ncbi:MULTISPECIES: hypothetical protein [Xenorhabdus]|nr:MULTISPECIES: hypothetical protein [unclassified Xenorhabdus]PHM56923.1 hypothetical protein Xekk_01489 [Xenorhabdus sp. KK7.4]
MNKLFILIMLGLVIITCIILLNNMLDAHLDHWMEHVAHWLLE